MKDRIHELLEIHCLDPMKIKKPETVKQTHATFHFHKNFREVPGDVGIICALHPSPWAIQAYSEQWTDDDLKNSHYPGVLGRMVKEKLVEEGIIIFQFDDQLEEAQGDRWWEILLTRVEEEACFRAQKIHLRRRSDLEVLIGGFPSNTYTFSSLHIFDKVLV